MSKDNIEQLLVEHQLNFLKNLEVVLSGFIHDVNNPVAVISGQSSIMKTLIEMDKFSEEKALKGSTKILNSTKKMGVIIQGLRDFYKPTALNENNANLKLSIDTIYKLSIPKIFRNDLQVTFNLFEDETVSCIGNPLFLNILFWNIHYMFLDKLEQSPEDQLDISCNVTSGKATISYELTTNGLSENYKDSSEFIVANSFADKLGAEITTSSPKNITISLNTID